jgi:shikimate kinase
MEKNIVFIGLSGCGKTTIGKAVANKLCLPFYDIDEHIEQQQGKLIREIFQEGEVFFRELESKAIKELSENPPSVISTGGGAVKVSSNMETLSRNSFIIFINRPIENIIKDIDLSNRPLLAQGASKLYELYEERYALYKKYSHIEVINDTSLESIVDKIVGLVKEEISK